MIGIFLGLISFAVFCLVAGWVINGLNRLIEVCGEIAKESKDEKADGSDVFLLESNKNKKDRDPRFRRVCRSYIVSYFLAKLIMSTLELLIKILEFLIKIDKASHDTDR